MERWDQFGRARIYPMAGAETQRITIDIEYKFLELVKVGRRMILWMIGDVEEIIVINHQLMRRDKTIYGRYREVDAALIVARSDCEL